MEMHRQNQKSHQPNDHTHSAIVGRNFYKDKPPSYVYVCGAKLVL